MLCHIMWIQKLPGHACCIRRCFNIAQYVSIYWLNTSVLCKSSGALILFFSLKMFLRKNLIVYRKQSYLLPHKIGVFVEKFQNRSHDRSYSNILMVTVKSLWQWKVLTAQYCSLEVEGSSCVININKHILIVTVRQSDTRSVAINNFIFLIGF